MKVGPVGSMIGGVWLLLFFKCECGVGKEKKHRLQFKFEITTRLCKKLIQKSTLNFLGAEPWVAWWEKLTPKLASGDYFDEGAINF